MASNVEAAAAANPATHTATENSDIIILVKSLEFYYLTFIVSLIYYIYIYILSYQEDTGWAKISCDFKNRSLFSLSSDFSLTF